MRLKPFKEDIISIPTAQVIELCNRKGASQEKSRCHRPENIMQEITNVNFCFFLLIFLDQPNTSTCAHKQYAPSWFLLMYKGQRSEKAEIIRSF